MRSATATIADRDSADPPQGSGAPGGTALGDCARAALRVYLKQMAGHEVKNLMRFVLDEVERPLLETVLESTGGNQTLAARMLGISRGTLRKKLEQLGVARDAQNRS